MKKKEYGFEEIMKNIDWGEWIKVIIPVMQPMIIFGAWLGLSKIDNRADAVSKIIAFIEPIPTLDLNVPRPVVLASIYHAIDETMDIIEGMIKFLGDVPEDLIELFQKLRKDTEIAIKEKVPFAEMDPSQLFQMKSDFEGCQKATKNLLPLFRDVAFAACMLRKGWDSDLWGEL